MKDNFISHPTDFTEATCEYDMIWNMLTNKYGELNFKATQCKN